MEKSVLLLIPQKTKTNCTTPDEGPNCSQLGYFRTEVWSGLWESFVGMVMNVMGKRHCTDPFGYNINNININMHSTKYYKPKSKNNYYYVIITQRLVCFDNQSCVLSEHQFAIVANHFA